MWKIRELENSDLTPEQQDNALRNNDAISLTTSRRTEPKRSLVSSVFKGVFVVQRV